MTDRTRGQQGKGYAVGYVDRHNTFKTLVKCESLFFAIQLKKKMNTMETITIKRIQ